MICLTNMKNVIKELIKSNNTIYSCCRYILNKIMRLRYIGGVTIDNKGRGKHTYSGQ